MDTVDNLALNIPEASKKRAFKAGENKCILYTNAGFFAKIAV